MSSISEFIKVASVSEKVSSGKYACSWFSSPSSHPFSASSERGRNEKRTMVCSWSSWGVSCDCNALWVIPIQLNAMSVWELDMNPSKLISTNLISSITHSFFPECVAISQHVAETWGLISLLESRMLYSSCILSLSHSSLSLLPLQLL